MQNFELRKLEQRRAAIFGEKDDNETFIRLCGTYDLKTAVEICHDMIILDAARRWNYNISQAAREIGVNRHVLKSVCQKYGIDNRSKKKNWTRYANPDFEK